MIALKRAYEPARSDDGQRFLVERLWPRGVKEGRVAHQRLAEGRRAQGISRKRTVPGACAPHAGGLTRRWNKICTRGGSHE